MTVRIVLAAGFIVSRRIIESTKFFNKGYYVQALETFKQIHFISWANLKAYLGASICFLKLDRPDDAGRLALEVLSVLSNDMIQVDECRSL